MKTELAVTETYEFYGTKVHLTPAVIDDEPFRHLRIDSERGSFHLPSLTRDEVQALCLGLYGWWVKEKL